MKFFFLFVGNKTWRKSTRNYLSEWSLYQGSHATLRLGPVDKCKYISLFLFLGTKFALWNEFNNHWFKQEGRINQYNQGLFLRKRYDDFLGTSYSSDIFYLQSTAVDRAKMSAMLEAASLWKPNKEQMFKPDLPWQPVVLFYQEQTEDTVKYFCLSRRSDSVKNICNNKSCIMIIISDIWYHHDITITDMWTEKFLFTEILWILCIFQFMLVWNTCPKYTQLRDLVNDLPEVQRVYESNKILFEELTNFTGMQIANADDVSSFYATLAAEVCIT